MKVYDRAKVRSHPSEENRGFHHPLDHQIGVIQQINGLNRKTGEFASAMLRFGHSTVIEVEGSYLYKVD